jgi:pyridoxamine 5'-phosphate oxidase family protein
MSATSLSAFTDNELLYLTEADRGRLARIATVGKNGTPHVTPVGWRYNGEHDAIEIGGVDLERTKKFRDSQRTGRAAVVIDDLASIEPWRPRGIEIRGAAEAIGGARPVIRLHPERIISWGIESDAIGQRHARTVR